MGPNRSPWRRAVGGSLVGLALGLAGCGRELPQTPFDPAGPVARWQLEVLSLTMWLALAVGVVVAGLTAYVVVRFRDRGGKVLPTPVHGDHRLEILWTLIPIVILAIIAVPTVKKAFQVSAAPAGDTLKVRVVAKQWFWNFEYPDLGIATANELLIPAGRAVEMTVESEDVIHSFWVPKLAGTIDVIPNRVNTIWLQADQPGVYWGQCKEFCGQSHAKMRFRVLAQSQDEFDAWVKTRQAKAAPVVAGDNQLARQGEDLFFGAKNCYVCHAVDGTRAQGKVGPNLTGVATRTTIAAGTLENSDANLARWLQDPTAVKPGNKMGNLGLKDDEINALIAYLHTLK